MFKETLNKKMVVLRVLILFIAIFLSTSAFAQNDRPRLGLSVSPLQASPILLQHLRLSEGEGLMVSNIAVGGTLEAAGLSQGDIVLAIDGKILYKPTDLVEYLATRPKDAQVTLDVIQKGEHRQIYVQLDNLPDEIVWKYAQPVSGPGSSQLGMRSGSGRSLLQPRSSTSVPGHVNSHAIFKSMVYTDAGAQMSTVELFGDKDDPDTAIEITLGNDIWKTTVGEIQNLPEAPKTAAQNAIAQAGRFSFSFGSGDDLFEEMMRRHQEQMRRMDEMFNRPAPSPLQQAPGNNAPSNIDIRS